MSNLEKSVDKGIHAHEDALLSLIVGLCASVGPTVGLARDKGLSTYQILRGLKPLAAQIGSLGDAAESQIDWHDAIAVAAKTAGVQVRSTDPDDGTSGGPGRDKD